ncbi:unknown protein [Seminavis robusta]|uniref:Uncharacterized protein n=1 Tax=Seminavis robusta TaxID=568900 RepID=A0A9N8F0L0_9STRA|nr:unknown protein [Seminavis robusta]|eukprot:Sro2844_g338350.1 n/a (172) ;mRNA; r:2829-3568
MKISFIQTLALSFCLLDPATKEVGTSSLEKFAPGALYPFGDHKLSDLVKAFDAVPISDAKYDVIKHHCALLVLQMLCHLEIPVNQEMKDWVGDELMKTNKARDHIVSLARDSINFELLGIARNESTATSIRTLVAYDADIFYCAATEKKQLSALVLATCLDFFRLLAFLLL